MSTIEEAAWPHEQPPFSVRHLKGVGWQVQGTSSDQWHTCRKEQDACFIASGMRTLDAITRGEHFGREVAEELEAVAAVVSHVLGPDEADRIMQAAQSLRNQPAA